jgi:HD-GYP domain-containing protein (c-di-GMP phosphodiesterase class II)
MRRGLQSLFHQNLERAIFVVYFVGAVLPLVVLGALAHPVAISTLLGPAFEATGVSTATSIGVTAGASLLSLASFFALKRLVGAAVGSIEADKATLEQLLRTVRVLGGGAHASDIARTSADCALAVSSANACFVLLHSEKDDEPSRVSSAGSEADHLFSLLELELAELAENAIEAGHPAHLSFDRGSDAEVRVGSAVAVPLLSDNAATGAFVALRVGEGQERFGAREVDSLQSLAAFAALALENDDLELTQRNFFSHVTDLLVMALDTHIDRRFGHATKVSRHSHRLGRELGLDEERMGHLYFAALLHDLGMLKVAREHQRDPAQFQKHPMAGARMLTPIRRWKDAAPIVLHHHEHYDGSGYPFGLVGDAIPLESRIILVADTFDAMTRDDAQRSGLSLHDALEELRSGMGTQFDPDVVNAFLDLQQRGELDLDR